MRNTIFLIFNIWLAMNSCNSSFTTPQKFKNNIKVNRNLYVKDSLEINSVLKKMLMVHLHPFRPEKQFDSTTKIFIDSIIYNKDKLKMIALVITKNSTSKLLKKGNNESYFYNGNYLFCSRDNRNSPIKVYDYAAFNLAYYYSYNDLKARLNEYCFSDIGNEKGKYNLDDVRIWQANDFNWVINNSKATQLP